jgi:deoxyribose-phosphate aldolase
MFRELACYSQDSTYEEILEAVFTSSEKDMSCLAIPSGFMSRLSEFTKNQKFSVAIDFPYGISGTQIRVHEIILAIRQGASYIDLVINNGFIKEENWRKIREDLKSCLAICNEHDIELRAIIEYRLFPVKTVLLMCDLFYQAGVNNIINATGFIADDISDNAIISYEMHEKTGVFVTSCIRAFNKSHIVMFEDMGVYALRFMSSKVAGDIL